MKNQVILTKGLKDKALCFTIIILSLISSIYSKCILSDDPTTTEKSKLTTVKEINKITCPPCVCKNND